jgi:hypothetical protein
MIWIGQGVSQKVNVCEWITPVSFSIKLGKPQIFFYHLNPSSSEILGSRYVGSNPIFAIRPLIADNEANDCN